jgi:hypothetical protein
VSVVPAAAAGGAAALSGGASARRFRDAAFFARFAAFAIELLRFLR